MWFKRTFVYICTREFVSTYHCLIRQMTVCAVVVTLPLFKCQSPKYPNFFKEVQFLSVAMNHLKCEVWNYNLRNISMTWYLLFLIIILSCSSTSLITETIAVLISIVRGLSASLALNDSVLECISSPIFRDVFNQRKDVFLKDFLLSTEQLTAISKAQVQVDR